MTTNPKPTGDQSCDHQELLEALWQSPDATVPELEAHLSTCESCRRKIESLAGDDDFWQKASTVLGETAEMSSEKAAAINDPQSSVLIQLDSRISRPEFHHVDKDQTRDQLIASHVDERALLDPPLHPEMLGRVDGFSVEQVIGRGGMGIVYKGFDSNLNRPVAIKFLSPHMAAHGVARARFIRESRAAAAVVHPNVVPIFSVNTSPVRPYLVMALISGPSLQKHVQDHGPLPTEDIVRIGHQIAHGLAAAHQQGLVHRDIKPANIMLENDVSRVLITDFGLARAADDAGLTQTGWLAGTPHYMSPEQVCGDQVDHRSDLFSLGSVMYFMATGREPFRGDNTFAVLKKIGGNEPPTPRSINSDIPSCLNDFICRLLAKHPDGRFESAQSVHDALTQYLAHLQNPTQHRLPKFAKNTAAKSRGQTLFAVTVLVVALGLTLAGWVALSGNVAPSPTVGSDVQSADDIPIAASSSPGSSGVPESLALSVGGANVSQRSNGNSTTPDSTAKSRIHRSESSSLISPADEANMDSFRLSFERFNRELVELDREILEMEVSLKIQGAP